MENIEKLKTAIEFQFGKKVENTKSSIELSEDIFNKTGILINYNTIRRLYQLIGSVSHSLSKNSLDIFAIYCGFENYDMFSQKIDNRHNKYSIYSNLIIDFDKQRKINYELVYKVCEQSPNSDQTYFFLNEVGRIAFLHRDTQFLERFFELLPIFKTKNYLDNRLFFLTQIIGSLTRNYAEKHSLWKSWAKSKYGRSMYFEFFVDMDYLMQDHYRAIQEYIKYSKDNPSVFGNTILFFYYYNKKEVMIGNSYLDQLRDINPLDVHPILAARLITYRWLQNNKISDNEWKKVQSHLQKENNKVTKSSQPLPYFQAWLCEGLCLLKEFEKVIDVYEQLSSEYFKINNFVSEGLVTRLKIYYYLSLSKTNKHEKANFVMKTIDLNSLNSYSFYYDSTFFRIGQTATSNYEKTKLIEELNQKSYQLLLPLISD